jgi:acetyl esterase/lipase
MPIGYLIPALLVLMSAYLVLTPMSWPRPRFWWIITAVINELPHFAGALLLPATVLAFIQGDIASTGGWIAFGFHVVAIASLLVMFAAAFRTPPAARRALDEALGPDWQAALPPEVVERLNTDFTPRALLGPFAVRYGPIEHLRDVAYGDAGRANALDLYRDPAASDGRPVFIHLHGGALRGGKKDNDARPVLYHLAAHGWLCLSANYRLQPEATFAEQVADIRTLVAWTRANAHAYGGDPAFVMLGGGSSGGHLAALVGLEPGVDAVVALYGQFAFGPADESPITYVHEAAPPFFLLHGDHDNLVPVAGTRRFAAALRAVSRNPVAYAELPRAEHNFDQFNSVRSLAVARAVEAFGCWAQAATLAHSHAAPQQTAVGP